MTDPNINKETGESVQGRSPRFTLWVSFLVFSAITLGSSVEVKHEQSSPTAAAKWAVACSAVTFAITALIVVMHVVPVCSTLIAGTRLEGVICVVLVAFWAATVSIVTDANNQLSVLIVSPGIQDLNGNLYYFSWAGFVTSIILTVSYLRSAFGIDVMADVKNRAARLTLWAGFLASSLVVMGSSSRILRETCGYDDVPNSGEFCRRTKYAISVGTIGIILSVLIVACKLMTSTAPFIFEFAFSIILTVLNAFGVAYTTSARGPGSSIGNLYYFSWSAFLCASFLAADCFNQFTSANAGGTTTPTPDVTDSSEDDPYPIIKTATTEEIEVEEVDDL